MPDERKEGGAERERLELSALRKANWQRWGPYLSERQWGTVREDYSADGNSWAYFPHDHARSRAYRWGEDGLLGIADRECRLCFCPALWNGKGPILKERLFGLAGPEGNHGEDVKECYYYLDSSPTHSYMKALYKYPQAAYPYDRLVEENRCRGHLAPEFEILETGVFDEERYFDLYVEYAKGSPNDILIRLTAINQSPEPAALHLLPTLWFRNTWTPGCTHDECSAKPSMARETGSAVVFCDHPTLGRWRWLAAPGPQGEAPTLLFTENETNTRRLYGAANDSPFVKDAFHEYLIQGRADAVNPGGRGTKAAALYRIDIPSGEEVVVRLRLFAEDETPEGEPFGESFDRVFEDRLRETDEFYRSVYPEGATAEEKNVLRQAYAGLLWSKQFYHYVVQDWLEGDPDEPPPPDNRWRGRNHDWLHIYNRDVISMPDKWEYPWYAAWDLAFHTIPFARIDPSFARDQLVLFLREWYMRTDGQIPAYEWDFGDVNPPMHAWACWRIYQASGPPGQRDRVFLSRVFQKLLINFTWWVNRKDPWGRHVFSGGFLGLDNIGVFDRSKPLPTGEWMEQADATAWMGFYCTTMLEMAMELSLANPATEDMASKFFEHFVAIADAMNSLGGTGLWDEEDGFYYDQIILEGRPVKVKLRSMVGIVPLFAAAALHSEEIDRLSGFKKRMEWFVENRPDLARHIACMEEDHPSGGRHIHRLLAIPSRQRLESVLRYVLDEKEFLSPYGVRSVSRFHQDSPYVFQCDGHVFRVQYAPGESDSDLFGGNSNWRGPVWFPLNFLLIEALERYYHFYGDDLMVECPTGSGQWMNLHQVALDLSKRLANLFVPGKDGCRPCHGHDRRYADHPNWRDLVLFHEYFHGEDGRGQGANHQTGWTSLVVECIENVARARSEKRNGNG
ncbi:glucosidase [Candidatus Sumerlaeota bacterium]|nr:glucosidase [Candidatus Sumerlaeota bacterium]